MPRQNRVTPAGQLVADASKAGEFMGNRGCLHDKGGNIVRQWRGKRWVCCVLHDPRLKSRKLMTPGHYTELFFLDEATALAAGHRPCHYCRRDASNKFLSAWALAHPEGPVVSADTIDARLHPERTARTHRRVEDVRSLPEGSFVRDSATGGFLLVHRRGLLPWSFMGYGQPVAPASLPIRLEVITPQSIVTVLSAGYHVCLHPSASA